MNTEIESEQIELKGDNPWKSREFIITLAVLAIGAGLIFTGSKDEGINLVTWVALGYIGSRTAVKMRSKVN